MRYVVQFEGKEIGAVITNHSMTNEEICEMSSVKLMITKEDYESGNGYDIEDLEFEQE